MLKSPNKQMVCVVGKSIIEIPSLGKSWGGVFYFSALSISRAPRRAAAFFKGVLVPNHWDPY